MIPPDRSEEAGRADCLADFSAAGFSATKAGARESAARFGRQADWSADRGRAARKGSVSCIGSTRPICADRPATGAENSPPAGACLDDAQLSQSQARPIQFSLGKTSFAFDRDRGA